jgi:type I restriction enzyme R subunit
LTEADWEESALDELAELAWHPLTGPQIAPGSGHRRSWDDPVMYDECGRPSSG